MTAAGEKILKGLAEAVAFAEARRRGLEMQVALSAGWLGEELKLCAAEPVTPIVRDYLEAIDCWSSENAG